MNYKKIVLLIADTIFFILFLFPLLGLALLWKVKPKAKTPKLMFGPVPIINNKYWSIALREHGYASKTIMFNHYAINNRSDFDHYYSDFNLPFLGKLNPLLLDYSVFLFCFFHFDIYHFSFDGGVMQRRYFFNRFEFILYKISGKKTVILPYGSDIYLYSRFIDIPWKQSLMISYPQHGKNEPIIARRLAHIQKYADFIVAYIDYVFMLSRWDLLTVGAYTIDETLWYAPSRNNRADGTEGIVRIAHAPNHRGVKGTEFVLEACRELKNKGYQIELILLEKMKNDDVREILKSCDVLIDQLNLGYALNAIEGMALSIPVISNLTNETYTKVFKQYAFLDECPLISTDYAHLGNVLEKLITAPSYRKEIGDKGRKYVEKYHSKKTAYLMFSNIYASLWQKQNTDLINYFHPILGKYQDDLAQYTPPGDTHG